MRWFRGHRAARALRGARRRSVNRVLVSASRASGTRRSVAAAGSRPTKRKRPPLRIYAAPFDLAPARQCYVLIDRDALTSGRPPRVDAPSDWLSQLETSLEVNTLKSKAQSVAWWWSWCADRGVDPLRTDATEFGKFVRALQTAPKEYALTSKVHALPGDARLRDASTIALRVRHIKTFYAWAEPNGRASALTAMSMAAFKTPRASPSRSAGRLSPEQVSNLFARRFHPRDRFGLEVLYGTGLRGGEALGLLIDDMCLNREIARIFHCPLPTWEGPHLHVRWRINSNGARAKSRYPRWVPLPSRVVVAWENWSAWAYNHRPGSVDCPFLFQAITGPIRPLSVSGFRSMWVDHVRTIPMLGNLHPHLLRHTYASELIDAGVDSFYVQQLLGHRSPTSTAVYTKPHMNSLFSAVGTLMSWREREVGLTQPADA
jgi:site-specific recombinase XerD